MNAIRRNLMIGLSLCVAAVAGVANAVEPDCAFKCNLPFPISANLELRPSPVQNFSIGQEFTVGLYAVPSDPDLDTRVAAVQTILNWDPSKIRLLGLTNNGPYAWIFSAFVSDVGLDNLNNGVDSPPLGVPNNDGDAFYSALQQFPPPLGPGPALLPDDGLLVTTFRFRALANTPGTDISIPLSTGAATCTAIFWGEGAPSCGITGTLGIATVQIGETGPVPGDGDNDGDVDLDDFTLFDACVQIGGGTPACLPFDFDDDDDTDLIDFAGFQAVFGG